MTVLRTEAVLQYKERAKKKEKKKKGALGDDDGVSLPRMRKSVGVGAGGVCRPRGVATGGKEGGGKKAEGEQKIIGGGTNNNRVGDLRPWTYRKKVYGRYLSSHREASIYGSCPTRETRERERERASPYWQS